MSHVDFVIIFLPLCRMSLRLMLHVDLKKCPCCPVDFRGQEPYKWPCLMSLSFLPSCHSVKTPYCPVKINKSPCGCAQLSSLDPYEWVGPHTGGYTLGIQTSSKLNDEFYIIMTSPIIIASKYGPPLGITNK